METQSSRNNFSPEERKLEAIKLLVALGMFSAGGEENPKKSEKRKEKEVVH